MNAPRPSSQWGEEQSARDLFDYAATLEPGEALNAIGYLSHEWSGPRAQLLIRTQPTVAAATFAIVLALVTELAKRVLPGVPVEQGVLDSTRTVDSLLKRTLHDAIMGGG